MTTADDDGSTRRSALVPVVVGMFTLGAVFAVGAIVSVPNLETNLRHDAQARLLAAGIAADVAMSGQTATLVCIVPLVDPAAAKQVVSAVGGVHAVEIDQSCAALGATGDASGTSTTEVPVAVSSSTVTPTTVTPTTVTPTTVIPTTSTTVVPVARLVVRVQLVDGRLLVAGKVASRHQRDLIAYIVGHAVAEGNLVLALTYDPSVKVTDDQLGRLGAVAVAMPVDLVSGSVGIEGTRLHVVGRFADDAHRGAFERVVTAAGADSELVLRATASAVDAAKVQADMNALVTTTPIVYTKGAVDIAPESKAVIERLAGIAKRFAGLAIEAQGHTDSEGVAARNLLLSQRRAQAAIDAMVALGVPVADLSAKGFGETQLIVDQTGKEIPAKSRRVVFGVSLR
ncbi:MAG: OmpA family protein [Actinomycetota bacterium]